MGTDWKGGMDKYKAAKGREHDGETADITVTCKRDEMFKKKRKKRMRHAMEFVDTRIKQRDGCAGGEDECMMHPAPFETDQM